MTIFRSNRGRFVTTISKPMASLQKFLGICPARVQTPLQRPFHISVAYKPRDQRTTTFG